MPLDETAQRIMDNIEKQEKYCKENNFPDFSPAGGICYSCHRQVFDQKEFKPPITGCPFCHTSYCD